jgi:hypothetical protein
VAGLSGFELQRPTPSRTFAGKAARLKKARQMKRKALLKGVRKSAQRGQQGRGAYSKPSIVVDLEVRHGSGRVQFKKEAVSV